MILCQAVPIYFLRKQADYTKQLLRSPEERKAYIDPIPKGPCLPFPYHFMLDCLVYLDGCLIESMLTTL